MHLVRTLCDQHNRQRQRKHEMQLSVVVKQEMSHSTIHHVKQHNPISHTHRNIVNHIALDMKYTRNGSYPGVVTDGAPGYCSRAAVVQVKTTSLQLLFEVISGCQARNVTFHNPSFETAKSNQPYTSKYCQFHRESSS